MAFFNIRLTTFLALLLLSVSSSVYAQDGVPRTDLLKGTKGERACDLEVAIFHCQDKKATRAEIEFDSRAIAPVTPRPPTNLCTCNTYYFNIWSACTWSLGYGDMPQFNDLLTYCANHTVSIAQSQQLAHTPGGLGVEIPGWATVPVPGGKYFDMQLAVMVATNQQLQPSGKWTTVQIVLPIITALASALLMLVVFLIFRRRYASSGSTIPLHNLSFNMNPTSPTRRPSSRGMERLSSFSNLKEEAAKHDGVQ